MLMAVVIADAQVPYVVGDHVADFTLNDAFGNPVSLYDFEGMVVWLVFWRNT
jgi:peroxiredoxin